MRSVTVENAVAVGRLVIPSEAFLDRAAIAPLTAVKNKATQAILIKETTTTEADIDIF